MNNPWHEVPVGTIVDSDINRLAAAHQLIIEGFDSARVKQACYELRASEIFYDVQSSTEHKRRLANDGYLLKPGCCVVCITKEKVRLPPNVLARILTKGRLFSVGILPVNTYADPGFEGRLGITLWNASHRYLIIKPDEPIAKIEFAVLPKPVAQSYAGQHGYETEMWPILTQLYADTSDPKVAPQIRSVAEEVRVTHGSALGDMVKQFQFYRLTVHIQIAVTLASFAILFILYEQLSLVSSLTVGVASNLLTTFVVWATGKWRDR